MLSDGPFDVLERPIALRADNHTYRELEVETRPQLSWTAVQAERRGLAVVSSGLLECAVRDLPERPLALTLLRSTRRTVMTDGEPAGLLLGMELRFRLWIVPLSDEPDRVKLYDLGRLLAAGVRIAHVRPPRPHDPSPAIQLPAESGFLAIEGPLALSSLRHVGETMELRIFNPNPTPATAILRFPPQCRISETIDLAGNPLGTSQPLDETHAQTITLNPKQILSLRLRTS
ncbi:MAG: hypothetical protein HC822_17440 [Oscillochloris sp.]|nr:hypothetical protein [Oscillochloris sp.]